MGRKGIGCAEIEMRRNRDINYPPDGENVIEMILGQLTANLDKGNNEGNNGL